MKHDVIIYGAGGMASEVYEFSFCNGDRSSIGNVIGYFADCGSNRDFERVTGLAFVELTSALTRFPELRVLICIGDVQARKTLAQRVLDLGAKLKTFIHPTAIIAKSSYVGEGSVIYPFVVVSSNARVGQCCAINSYTGVGHDVEVGDFCVISAQVDLTGYVKLGESVFIGSGARILPHKKIGSHSKISAGVTVIRSMPPNSILYPKANESNK